MESNVVPLSGTNPGPVDRAAMLLFALANSHGSKTLTELARELDLPKSTLHRLLAQLERHGFVMREGASHRLGPACARLGRAVEADDPLLAAARPIVAETSRKIGETLFVVAARAGVLTVVHMHEGTGLLRAAPSLGSTVPIHASAAGRLYLAFAPTELAKLPGKPPAFTERTPTQRDDIARRVNIARERGWDENVGEWVDGLAVVGSAIRTRDGVLHGVLTLALSEPRYLSLGARPLAQRLVSASAQIADRLEGKKA